MVVVPKSNSSTAQSEGRPSHQSGLYFTMVPDLPRPSQKRGSGRVVVPVAGKIDSMRKEGAKEEVLDSVGWEKKRMKYLKSTNLLK